MFKKVICLLIICFSSNVLHADDLNSLRQFIKTNFPQDLKVSAEQLQRLSYFLNSDKRRYDLEMKLVTKDIHIEVVRALTRIHCLQLLYSGTKKDYDKFIKTQLADKNSKPLTFNSFKKLSKNIQQLKQEDYKTLETTIILPNLTLPEDDELADKKILHLLYLPQANFRHMLYTENGANMFKYLRTMIQHQYITATEIDLWYAYWIIHIAGFRGHVAYSGSVYLTEPVYQAMNKLKSLIDQMLDSPNFNPLEPYLEYRADLLGLKQLPQQERLFLAHLGALMRLYNSAEGNQLHRGFKQLDAEQRQQAITYFNDKLLNYDQANQTFMPALFANTLVLTDGDIKRTIKIILPVYNQAVKLKPNTMLSFNKLSAIENLKQLIQLGAAGTEHIMIGDNGEVGLRR